MRFSLCCSTLTDHSSSLASNASKKDIKHDSAWRRRKDAVSCSPVDYSRKNEPRRLGRCFCNLSKDQIHIALHSISPFWSCIATFGGESDLQIANKEEETITQYLSVSWGINTLQNSWSRRTKKENTHSKINCLMFCLSMLYMCMCTKGERTFVANARLDQKEKKKSKDNQKENEQRNEMMAYKTRRKIRAFFYELQSPNVRFHWMYLSSVERVTLARIFRSAWTKSSRETGRMRLTDSFFNSSTRNSRTGPIAASFARAVRSLPE